MSTFLGKGGNFGRSSQGGSEVKNSFEVTVALRGSSGVTQVVILVYMNEIDMTFICPSFEIPV